MASLSPSGRAGRQSTGVPVKTLFILNDPPYGTERSYNALRLARALTDQPDQSLRIFLMGDAAGCAKSGHSVPQGYYNANRMLIAVARKQVPIRVCGSCMDARGIGDAELVEGTRRSNITELAEWAGWADKVVVF